MYSCEPIYLFTEVKNNSYVCNNFYLFMGCVTALFSFTFIQVREKLCVDGLSTAIFLRFLRTKLRKKENNRF